ncbi:MAG: hypothetical protein ACRDPK_15730 [Carbonactinosporaceae bacterium]
MQSGQPGGLVPPYEGRQLTTRPSFTEHMHKVMSGPWGPPGPERVVCDVELSGVPATDTTAASPLGVGVSTSAQGNERALGRSEEKRRKDREEAGVSPGQPIDPRMPNLRPGDQGG